jgi:predicted AlkP superfamily pyrophosphatase or phosphodiesterase
MIIISFDAVGDDEFERLASYPVFGAFVKDAAVFRNVPSLFVSNTYPIHASVATGVCPGRHQLIANNEPYPSRNPIWNSREDGINARTLWQAAHEKRIETAAFFWPVTAYSKTIRWNMPEVLARPGSSQLLTSLMAGNALMQAKLFLKHRRLFEGLKQPQLDNFATACACDILRGKKPGLCFIHLVAYDTICHKYGKGSSELTFALEALDKNLAALLNAAGDTDVLIFTDHSQINVRHVVMINAIIMEAGLESKGCFFECCGGSAFFHAGALNEEEIKFVKDRVEITECFRRFISDDEMVESGYEGYAAFGITAKAGYSFEAYPKRIKATHGYATDMPDYNVFYMAKGFGLTPGEKSGGSLLDIAPLAAKRLGLNM